jgi:hypothetical protein
MKGVYIIIWPITFFYFFIIYKIYKNTEIIIILNICNFLEVYTSSFVSSPYSNFLLSIIFLKNIDNNYFKILKVTNYSSLFG